MVLTNAFIRMAPSSSGPLPMVSPRKAITCGFRGPSGPQYAFSSTVIASPRRLVRVSVNTAPSCAADTSTPLSRQNRSTLPFDVSLSMSTVRCPPGASPLRAFFVRMSGFGQSMPRASTVFMGWFLLRVAREIGLHQGSPRLLRFTGGKRLFAPRLEVCGKHKQHKTVHIVKSAFVKHIAFDTEAQGRAQREESPHRKPFRTEQDVPRAMDSIRQFIPAVGKNSLARLALEPCRLPHHRSGIVQKTGRSRRPPRGHEKQVAGAGAAHKTPHVNALSANAVKHSVKRARERKRWKVHEERHGQAGSRVRGTTRKKADAFVKCVIEVRAHGVVERNELRKQFPPPEAGVERREAQMVVLVHQHAHPPGGVMHDAAAPAGRGELRACPPLLGKKPPLPFVKCCKRHCAV